MERDDQDKSQAGTPMSDISEVSALSDASNASDSNASRHPFIRSPHSTLIRLSFPVLLSLIAEPLTGLVDTIFVAKLGSAPLAALGVGTTVLSSIFWIFNFLGIASQTESADAMGHGDTLQLRHIATLAISMAVVLSLLVMLLTFPFIATFTHWMEATGNVHELAVSYIKIRLWGGPAILISVAAFGVMRGRQDMATPLWVAGGINVMNMILDPLLIFGWTLFPEMGVAGAAVASVLSQWTGAIACIFYLLRQLGGPVVVNISQAVALLKVGRDLFLRTGMLILFLLLTTRAATAIGAEAGAAHQAIRQVWFFTAFLLDAYATVGQSLVAYFLGADQKGEAKRVASIVCSWSFGTGLLLMGLMLLGQNLVIQIMVPGAAVAAFAGAWHIAAMVQPVNALAFATDGIHWGTGDYAYLRNVVLVSTISSSLLLLSLESLGTLTLTGVWGVMILWVFIRAIGGMVRIWPGMGKAPLTTH